MIVTPESIQTTREEHGLADATLPESAAIIMDGNGRWATRRGLPRTAGHRRGAEAVRRLREGGEGLPRTGRRVWLHRVWGPAHGCGCSGGADGCPVEGQPPERFG